MFYTTEITSTEHESDLPMLLRTQKAYEFIENKIHGDVLEIGCGEGYGINKYYHRANRLYLLDKSRYSERTISKRYKNITFYRKDVDELNQIDLPTMDCIICFQFIEHIEKQSELLNHLISLLKPEGMLFISTPNKIQTLFPNPWHIHEFDQEGFIELTSFDNCSTTHYGIFPSKKLEPYYRDNRSNLTFLKKNALPLVLKTPKALLKLPYEIGNRINRVKLKKKHIDLFRDLSHDDYIISEPRDNALDFLAEIKKDVT